MLSRVSFIKSAAAAFAAAASPSPTPLATPGAVPSAWEKCVHNPVLPYDHPLEIKMRVLDGPDFDLLQYRGSPTILHIFATWCEPCTYEMPYIVEMAKKYADRGLKIVGINDAEDDNTVRAYRKRFNIPFPIAMDQRGGFTVALESHDSFKWEIPVSLYFTPAGYLHCYTQGATQNAERELDFRISKFLADTAAPAT